MDKGIKLVIILGIVFSVVEIVFGGPVSGYSARTVFVYGLIGAFLGFAVHYWIKHVNFP